MEANIKRSWDEIAQTVQTLPKSWPSKLVFVTPPTIMSRPYSPSSNPLQPNDGPCRLETADPNNQDFLQLQMSVARNIELYQNFSTTLAITFVEDLRGISDGLDALKRDHWEEGRRTYHFDAEQPDTFEAILPPAAMMLLAPILLQTRGMSRKLAQFLLHFLYLLVTAVLQLSREEQQQLSATMPSLPQTTRYIFEALELEVSYIGYICCPRCFALYDADNLRPVERPVGASPPRTQQSVSGLGHQQTNHILAAAPMMSAGVPFLSWPTATLACCTYRSTPGSQPCGARLVTASSASETDEFDVLYQQTYQRFMEAKLKPHLTFYVANLHQWVAELVTRPGMAEILRKVQEPQDRVQDIMQSKAIRELVGHDQNPFIGQHVEGIHLCFALFIDFFNSEGNFIGGKHNSTGGIFLVVLNLPVQLRYSAENMFPIFTPGGREPTTEELNNLLRPIVDQLISIYINGVVVHTRRGNSITKADVRAMVAIIIADTPAAKKIGGFASHAHRWFCHLCRLGREEIESNLDPNSWPRMPPEEHDTIAKAWRDAPTNEDREALFSTYGIRFSELHRIPYLRMTECIGAEPMHAIMQNTIQHHIRRTFGINAVQGDLFYDDEDEEEEEPIVNDAEGINHVIESTYMDSDEFNKGLAIFRRPGVDTRSLDMLANMRVDTLKALCNRAGVSTWQLPLRKQQPRRIDMVEALGLKMAEQRSDSGFAMVDTQEVRSILSSTQDVLAKRNRLCDLSPEALYEMCSLAGIDTASIPLQRSSIYPKLDLMVTALLNSSSGFNQRPDIQLVLQQWKVRRYPQSGQESLATTSTQRCPHFNATFLQEIWQDINRTVFPQELKDDRPPAKLGTKQHGRLKASQWRNVCCFTMLITLGRIWDGSAASEQDKVWLQSYLHLVALVRIAYNYSITQEDITAFRHHSLAYLNGLRTYHPTSIKPSHHFLLHLPELMERFGPIRGWWAFPFERFNGQIQRLSTNHKVGEVEKHFMTQWFRFSRMHTKLASPGVSALKPLITLCDRELGTKIALPPSHTGGSPQPTSIGVETEPQQVSAETIGVMRANGLPFTARRLKVLSEVKFQHYTFERYSHSRVNGLVEYPSHRNSHALVGYIHEMIQYTPEGSDIPYIVGCIAQCSQIDEQFLENRLELGARLCGRDVEGYTLVPMHLLSHVVRYPWSANAQLIISVHNSDAAIYGEDEDDDMEIELEEANV